MLSFNRFQGLGYFCSILLGLLTFAGPGNAHIVTSPTGLGIPAPASVLEGQLESDSFAVFAERQAVNLIGVVDVNLIGDATISFPLTSVSFASGSITVDSYMVHYDPASSFAGGQKTVSGSVTFDETILAVIVGDTLLDLSDGIFGAAGTLYPTRQRGRGLEDNHQKDDDSLTVLGKLLTITLLLETGDAPQDIDQIRVLTSSSTPGPQNQGPVIQEQQIPEPPALIVFGIGLAGLGVVRRKRFSKVKGKRQF